MSIATMSTERGSGTVRREAWPLRDVRVLVVDPDPAERQRLAVALARAGARVRGVGEVDEALGVVALEEIDVLVFPGPGSEWVATARAAATSAGRALVALAIGPAPLDPSIDGHVDRMLPARAVVERLSSLLGRTPTQRLPRVG